MLIKLKGLLKSDILKNSFWGLISNVIQNAFLSLFFVMVARYYSTTDFAHYLIANTLYQFVATFSALGLGQWFIREIAKTTDKENFKTRFIKIQLYLGVVFFAVNVVLGTMLYNDSNIRYLSMLLGINILFDNIIYSIRNINIAESAQKRTFIIFIIEAISKFLIACLLFAYPFSIMTLAIVLVIVRFCTLNLFLKIGLANPINVSSLWESKTNFSQIRELVISNWIFVVIGSVSIVYWRIAVIIVSKTLSIVDVAHYEISYKLFSLALLLPLIVSTTVFPTLIRLYNEAKELEFITLYKRIYKVYLFFGLLAFTFIFSFSDTLIPLAFGNEYTQTSVYTKQMFLTILVFPTAYLQANLLIALGLERFDMWFNILTLITNIVLIVIGLHFVKSLTVINLSIFLSFLLFHLSQDVLLIKKKISTVKETVLFYLTIVVSVVSFVLISSHVEPYITFTVFWFIFLAFILPNTKDFKVPVTSLNSK